MMSRKTLGILAGVLVVLGLLSYTSSRSRYSTAEGGGFSDVLAEPVDPGSVETIRAWLGSLPDEPVVLERAGDGWQIASRWGWTAKEDLVKRLLDDFAALRGERRASSEDVLTDFQADEESGLHVVAEASGGTELFHIVVGKTALRGGGFVRQHGSSDVYLTPATLRSSFGVWGEEPSAPDAKRWIELRVHQADRQDVDRIVVRDGSEEIVLEKEFELAAAPVPEETTPEDGTDDAEAGDDADGEEDAPEAEEPAAPTLDRSQWTWKPDSAGEFDKGKVDGILGTLCSLYAFDVSDPDSIEAQGLADPERSVEVSLQDGSSVSIFFGATTDEDKKVFFRVGEDGKPAVIYKSTVDRIFQERDALKPSA